MPGTVEHLIQGQIVYDNAMAEAFNSLYKFELIYRQGPWRVSTTSSSPPSATSTGSTTAACWARSPTTTPTYRQRSSKPPTTRHNQAVLHAVTQ
jgi:hypothetical protein